MGFWFEVLSAAASSIDGSTSSDVKIQIRHPNNRLWQDFSYVSSNPESVQNGIQLAASAYPDADVRAIDEHGGMRDFTR